MWPLLLYKRYITKKCPRHSHHWQWEDCCHKTEFSSKSKCCRLTGQHFPAIILPFAKKLHTTRLCSHIHNPQGKKMRREAPYRIKIVMLLHCPCFIVATMSQQQTSKKVLSQIMTTGFDFFVYQWCVFLYYNMFSLCYGKILLILFKMWQKKCFPAPCDILHYIKQCILFSYQIIYI